MDNVVLGLSVAIAAVVILLLSCWDSKKKHTSKQASKPVNYPRPSQGQPAPERSDWGTGVQNSEFRDRYKDLTNLAAYDDYNAVAQYMSIEPEVYESHSRYSEDMGRSTSGASMLPVRDDPNDVVPWVGLRKPRYHEAYANPGARQEHSEIPDQMRGNSFYCIG
jgi:hypothetical protein